MFESICVSESLHSLLEETEQRNKNKPYYEPQQLRELQRNSSYDISSNGSFIMNRKYEDLRIGAQGMRNLDSITYEDIQDSGKRLGSGTSGEVRKVIHKTTKVPYAVKIVNIGNHNATDKIIAELKSLYNHSSPQIIKLHNAFFRDGCVHMILDYMDCGSLAKLIAQCGPIPEDILSYFAKQILLGMNYLHTELNIVHRDLKPENILVNKKGEVKICDFGLAGIEKSNRCSVFGEFKTFQGSCCYMSPERLNGDKYSFDSDIWSIGLSLAEAKLGRFPYVLKEGTIYELLQTIESKKSIEFPEGTSEEFIQFIRDCTKLKDRPPASELLKYPFITKCTVDQQTVIRWIHNTYVKPRRLANKKNTESK